MYIGIGKYQNKSGETKLVENNNKPSNFQPSTTANRAQTTLTMKGATETNTQRTLLIYSGPTSTDRTIEKNGMYMDNMDYFLEHGVSCNNSHNAVVNNNKEQHTAQERVELTYVFVLTQQVADYYLGTDGKIAKKRRECNNDANNDFMKSNNDDNDEYIKVIVRQDRCYDMESMRIVLENHEMDVRNRYDNLLFVNCGLVGPKCK